MSKPIYLFSATPNPDVIHINSLDFKFFQPDIDFSKYDFLILTSKKAVDALSFYDKKDYINIPALCISEFTKNYYESVGGKVIGVGGGIGSDLLPIIKSYAKDKKWLYLRAKEIAGDGFNVDEVIVYESECSSEILNFRLNDEECTLIFTSPSSVRCFLKNNTITSKNKIIVIGKTTANSLPAYVKYTMPKINSIKECLKLANLLIIEI